MLTVVLADDDYLVKEILYQNIPWHELGMEVIGLAENGKEALDLCVNVKPDILVTDIKMPFYNGLEVAIQLMEHQIPTKTILISGVQDFNYARIALNVQAAGYILKPIQLKEVIAVLKKVRDAIEMEFQREQVVKRLEQQLADNMSLVRDKFLNHLVSEGALHDNELQEKLDYFKLPLKAVQDIIVVVAEIDDYESRVKSQGIDRIQFYNFSIKNLIEQLLNNYQAGICFTTRDNEFVMIFCGEYCKEDKMTQLFESIEQLLHDFDGITLSMGVGHCVSLKSAHLSYSSACSARSYKFYTGNNSIIHINDIVSSNSMDKTGDMRGNAKLHHLKKSLLAEIKLGNRSRVHQKLEEYCALLIQAKQLSQHYIRGLFLELIIESYREFCETEGEVTEVVASYTASMQSVMSVETIRDIKTHSSGVLLGIAEYYGAKYNKKHSNLIERIKNYVNESYMENISLADIANEVYMSPSYICAVFKRETEMTINEYIIEKKMNLAKKMLTSTKMKVLEIAEQLGYENSQYFSYSFKKYTGETPQQYRSRHTTQSV